MNQLESQVSNSGTLGGAVGIGALGPPSLGHDISTAKLHWDRT